MGNRRSFVFLSSIELRFHISHSLPNSWKINPLAPGSLQCSKSFKKIIKSDTKRKDIEESNLKAPGKKLVKRRKDKIKKAAEKEAHQLQKVIIKFNVLYS